MSSIYRARFELPVELPGPPSVRRDMGCAPVKSSAPQAHRHGAFAPRTNSAATGLVRDERPGRSCSAAVGWAFLHATIAGCQVRFGEPEQQASARRRRKKRTQESSPAPATRWLRVSVHRRALIVSAPHDQMPSMTELSDAALQRSVSRSSGQWVWWLVAAILGPWFFTLDVRHLVSSDEGRYAEIAREMFASGDWVTIRYNGLKYFE